MIQKDDKIYVVGHSGFIGSALMRQLKKEQYTNLITASHSELDLLDSPKLHSFLAHAKPDYIFYAGGKTGGLYETNTYRADFIYENIVMESNLIHQAFLHGVKKMIFLGCSCIYPNLGDQLMKEEQLFSGYPESAVESVAIAKIAGVKMCQFYNQQYGTDFIPVIPTNVYGIRQSYEIINSPVIPSLIWKFHTAKIQNEKQVIIWGDPKSARDFLFADDLARACIFLMCNYEDNDPINIGTGRGYFVNELAEIVKTAVGYNGEIVFDTTKPDGSRLTILQDVSKITTAGWRYQVELREGIKIIYDDILQSG